MAGVESFDEDKDVEWITVDNALHKHAAHHRKDKADPNDCYALGLIAARILPEGKAYN